MQTKSILLSLGTRRSARCNGCVQVDDSMKTHKNPELRASGVVADKAPVVAATAAAAKAPAVVKPPRFELQDKKWVVENQVRVARVWLLLACRLCDTCGRWIIRRWRLTTATSSKPCTFRTALARPTAPCCRSRQAPRSISAEEKILPPLTHAFTGEDQGQQHHDRRLQKDVPRRAQVCLPHTPPPLPHPTPPCAACLHPSRPSTPTALRFKSTGPAPPSPSTTSTAARSISRRTIRTCKFSPASAGERCCEPHGVACEICVVWCVTLPLTRVKCHQRGSAC